jgi:hypothetical protein
LGLAGGWLGVGGLGVGGLGVRGLGDRPRWLRFYTHLGVKFRP